MFNWLFAPSCPCDPAAKTWVEERLRWLSEEFGLHILLERPVVLPTPEFFPDAWEATPKGARTLFRRVCQYMNVRPNCVELEFFNDKQASWSNTFSGGTWSDGLIRLERSALDRPADLIGIMAHELAHQRLLGEDRFSSDEFDNELLTDLTAVYHGFGIFLANNPRKSTGELFCWPGTKLRRPEYLSEPMTAYAMAHIAWFRKELNPDWMKHLRWAQRSVFKEGLRYLEKTRDSSFQPVWLDTDD